MLHHLYHSLPIILTEISIQQGSRRIASFQQAVGSNVARPLQTIANSYEERRNVNSFLNSRCFPSSKPSYTPRCQATSASPVSPLKNLKSGSGMSITNHHHQYVGYPFCSSACTGSHYSDGSSPPLGASRLEEKELSDTSTFHLP